MDPKKSWFPNSESPGFQGGVSPHFEPAVSFSGAFCCEEFSWNVALEILKPPTLMVFCGWNKYTLPETNIARENGWLEDYFPFGMANFQGLC